jgi:DNA-binding transcriptional ArsR family regulator
MSVSYSVFKAIADPMRRDIIHLLTTAEQGLTIKELSAHYAPSRQGVRKHIQVLRQAGLLETKKSGRDVLCFAQTGPLLEVYQWVSLYEKFWDQKLDALGSYLDKKADTP